MINNCKFRHITFVNIVYFSIMFTIVNGDSSPLLSFFPNELFLVMVNLNVGLG